MKAFLHELLDYNHHYNKKLIEVFQENPDKISEKAHLLLSHLINAQKIWNWRIQDAQPIVGIWETVPFGELRQIDEENLEVSRTILEKENLEKVIEYTNSKGENFSNRLKDIIFHYLNHGTYHRAQIATEMKNAGLEPIASDFIFYKR